MALIQIKPALDGGGLVCRIGGMSAAEPTYAAIVLAAGKSERFGADKLAAHFRGQPLIAHAVAAACAAPVKRVIVVSRRPLVLPDDARIRGVTVESDALSQSLRAGLAEAGDCDAAFIFLGDMPLVPHGIAAILADALGDAIAAWPEHEGRPGHPLLLAQRGFELADALSGDEGLGRILRGRGDVAHLPINDPGVVLDADTPETLAALAASPPRDTM